MSKKKIVFIAVCRTRLFPLLKIAKYATYVQLCYIFFVLPWFIVLVRQAGAALVDRHRPFPDWVEAAPYIFFSTATLTAAPPRRTGGEDLSQ